MRFYYQNIHDITKATASNCEVCDIAEVISRKGVHYVSVQSAKFYAERRLES